MSGGHPGHGDFNSDLPLWAIQEIRAWREIGRELVGADCLCMDSSELRDYAEIGEHVCLFCRAERLLKENANIEL